MDKLPHVASGRPARRVTKHDTDLQTLDAKVRREAHRFVGFVAGSNQGPAAPVDVGGEMDCGLKRQGGGGRPAPQRKDCGESWEKALTFHSTSTESGLLPNGPRLSCGRNASRLTAGRLCCRDSSGAQVEFYPTSARPSASSAC